MAKVVESFLHDTTDAARLGNNARTRAQKEFSVEIMVERTLKYYVQLLDEAK
jgi:glycosyltransferase involved in cell wall biosynthesis